MSTILKALRRLESEKVVDTAERPLREEVAEAPPPRQRASRSDVWIPLAALALGLGVGVSVFWLWPETASTPDVAMGAEVPAAPVVERAPAPPPIARPAPVVITAPEPAREARTAERLPPIVSQSVEVVPRPPRELLIAADIPAASPPEPVAAPPAPAPAPPKAKAAAPKPAPAKTVARVEPAPKPKPAPALQSELPIARTYPIPSAGVSSAPTPEPDVVAKTIVEPAKPAPRVITEPRAPAVSDSPLRVAKTMWHPTRDRREAMIALGDAPATRVREGDTIGGFTVNEIQPAAVLFERDGERIRRALGTK